MCRLVDPRELVIRVMVAAGLVAVKVRDTVRHAAGVVAS